MPTSPGPDSGAARGYLEVSGKSKKWDGFSKPKSELFPKRITEAAIVGSAISRMSCVGDHASVVIVQLWRSVDPGVLVSGLALLHDVVECDQ